MQRDGQPGLADAAVELFIRTLAAEIGPPAVRAAGAIRGHLGEEASLFRNGDYSDPARIHGTEMPGLDQLAAGAARMTVRYEPLPAGAKITYSSVDPSLVTALHAWFDGQSSDHDVPGMGG
ncbi:MAG: hypothetical protein M3O70_26860 [Actinomycetota bacterium]|nr:hypothetical protein [Actinomycetota bacterium]